MQKEAESRVGPRRSYGLGILEISRCKVQIFPRTLPSSSLHPTFIPNSWPFRPPTPSQWYVPFAIALLMHKTTHPSPA